jgi:ArsR family transcriptional regulator
MLCWRQTRAEVDVAGKDEVQITTRELGDRCCAETVHVRFSEDMVFKISEDLKILGHPIRLQILDILARNEGEVCVCDLEAALPVKQPTISHHLRLLREAGLVDTMRQGLWAYYLLDREALESLRNRVSGLLESFA